MPVNAKGLAATAQAAEPQLDAQTTASRDLRPGRGHGLILSIANPLGALTTRAKTCSPPRPPQALPGALPLERAGPSPCHPQIRQRESLSTGWCRREPRVPGNHQYLTPDWRDSCGRRE